MKSAEIDMVLDLLASDSLVAEMEEPIVLGVVSLRASVYERLEVIGEPFVAPADLQVLAAFDQQQLEDFEAGTEVGVVLTALAFGGGASVDVQEAAERLRVVASEQCGLSGDSMPGAKELRG